MGIRQLPDELTLFQDWQAGAWVFYHYVASWHSVNSAVLYLTGKEVDALYTATLKSNVAHVQEIFLTFRIRV
jgi:hypothetical protein